MVKRRLVCGANTVQRVRSVSFIFSVYKTSTIWRKNRLEPSVVSFVKNKIHDFCDHFVTICSSSPIPIKTGGAKLQSSHCS